MTHCRALFASTSEFFAAQAALEEIAVREEDEGRHDASAVADIATRMRSAARELESDARALSGQTSAAEEFDEAWGVDYLATQSGHVERLSALAGELDELLRSGTLVGAVERGEFIDSVAGRGVNARIRTTGVAYVRELVDALGHHLDVVEELNRRVE